MDAAQGLWLLLALSTGILAAAVGRSLRFLSRGGALAAGAMAACLIGFGSWQWLAPMTLFFFTSSILSQISERAAPGIASAFEKGTERDAFQVFANGGIGCLLVLAAPWDHSVALYAAYLGSLAAATADTWGTELGVLSGARPRLIHSFKSVERGVSGAVSLPGLLGGLAGTVVIGASGTPWLPGNSLRVVSAIVVAGVAGTLLDSLLGAVAQGQYRCGACGALTERRVHCGAEAELARGVRWLTNDGVNLCCNAAGAILGYVLTLLIV